MTQSTPAVNVALDSTPEIGNVALMRRMLGFASRFKLRCARVLILRLVLLAVVLSGLSMVGLGVDVIRWGLNVLDRPPQLAVRGLTLPDWSPWSLVALVAAGVLVMAAMRAALFYLAETSAAELVQNRIIVDLRADVYAKLQRLSFRFYDANDSGSIINRVTADCRWVGMFINAVVFQAIDLVLTLSVSLTYMLLIHRGLTAACLATTPLIFGLAIHFGRTVKPAYKINRRRVDKLIVTLAEHVQGIHVVKGFASQDYEVAKFAERNDEVRDQATWIYRKVATFTPTVGMMTHVNMIVLLAYGGYLHVTDPAGLPLGTGLLVFAGLLQQFSTQVQNLANITNTIQISLTAAQRVFEVMDAPTEIQAKPDAIRIGRARGHLQFQGVSFAYRGGDAVLSDVSFEVEPGQCIALVGTTGSGKSTLLSLIPRFYDPTQGRILLDGTDLRDLDLDDLRRNIGLVFQENFLFSNTIAANIAFGHPDANPALIENAARIAAAHQFITELPQGYDTVLREGAVNLSGGQRQRLAIARALLLEPAILLLDDATAAVDPQTEHEILEAMDNAMQGRTTFVVAHRLSTLRRADIVLVLDHGRVVQTGTHDELMRSKGHYRKAAKLQLADDESRRLLGMEVDP